MASRGFRIGIEVARPARLASTLTTFFSYRFRQAQRENPTLKYPKLKSHARARHVFSKSSSEPVHLEKRQMAHAYLYRRLHEPGNPAQSVQNRSFFWSSSSKLASSGNAA